MKTDRILHVCTIAAMTAAMAMSLAACKDKVGPKAPDFKLPAVGGGQCDLSAAKGKAVLVEFFSYRCPYCRKEVPHLKELSGKFDSDKVVIFAVHTFGGARVEAQLAKLDFGKKVKVCLDDGTVTKKYSALPKPYGIHGVPHMLILDKKGRIRRVHRGLTKTAVLKKGLSRYAD